MEGWARVLSPGGGWDGWISLSKQPAGTIDYGVTLDEDNLIFEGFAWGDDVVGWIDFNPDYDYGGVVFSGAFPSINSFSVDTVVTGNKPYARWTTENVVTCDLVSDTEYEDFNVCHNENQCEEMDLLVDMSVMEETKYTLTCFNSVGMWIVKEYTPYEHFELSGNPMKVTIDFVGGGATTTPTNIGVIPKNGFTDDVSFTIDLSNLPPSPGSEVSSAIFSHQTLSFSEYLTNSIKSVLKIYAPYRFVGEKKVKVWGNTDEEYVEITVDAGDIEPVYEEI